MAERRTLGQALSPDKLAFIQGQPEPASALPVVRRRRAVHGSNDQPATLTERTIDTNMVRQKRRRAATPHKAPAADAILSELLVPLTTRLPHRLVEALRRVALERRLDHAQPDNIQEIVEEAISHWLERASLLP